jgi:hypothetical protein
MKKALLAVGLVSLLMLGSCTLDAPSDQDVSVAMTDYLSGMSEAMSGTQTVSGSSIVFTNTAGSSKLTINNSTTPWTAVFSLKSYKGATYTITGDLTCTYLAGNVDNDVTGDLAFTGGKVKKITYAMQVRGGKNSGTITINNVKYDAATYKKQ